MTPSPATTPAARALLDVVGAAPLVAEPLYGPAGSELYEQATAGDSSEITELLHAVTPTTGRILELACGGGRLLLPLMSLGREVVGLDLSARMVELAQQRIRTVPRTRRAARARASIADMTDFDLDLEFGAIVLAATSIGLLDAAGRASMYTCVIRHLAIDGRFFVTVPTSASKREPGSSVVSVVPLPTTDGGTSVVMMSDCARTDGFTRDVSAVRIDRGASGAVDSTLFTSVVHTVASDLLVAELADYGFELVAAHAVAGASGPWSELRLCEFARRHRSAHRAELQ